MSRAITGSRESSRHGDASAGCPLCRRHDAAKSRLHCRRAADARARHRRDDGRLLSRPAQPEHYMVPHAPMRFYGHVEIAVRTTSNPGAIASGMRDVIRTVAPGAAVETVLLSQRFADSVDQPRFALMVMAALAALAVALASVGLYGVLSYGVSQRRRELGVRAALGAARRDLVVLVVGDGLRVTAIGLAVGVAAAAALTRFMQSALFGVAPLDAASFLAAPIVLALVAALS